MLTSLVIKLTAPQEARLPAALGRAVHSLLLRLIRADAPQLATEIHEGDGPKPFTASNLGDGPAEGRATVRRRGGNGLDPLYRSDRAGE